MIPFEVSFDRTASFRGRPGNRPFVLMGDDTLDRLKSLRHRLGTAIAEKGMDRKGSRAHRDFAPHVTLLYGDRAVDEYPVAPIRWTVNEFVLIHSLKNTLRVGGSMYDGDRGLREGNQIAHHHLRHQELRNYEEGPRLTR